MHLVHDVAAFARGMRAWHDFEQNRARVRASKDSPHTRGSVKEMEVMTTVYVIALAMAVLGAGVVGWLWYAAYHAPFEPEQERIAAWLDAAAAGDPVAIAGVRRILADAAERSGLDAEALFAEYPLSRATREALSTLEERDAP